MTVEDLIGAVVREAVEGAVRDAVSGALGDLLVPSQSDAPMLLTVTQVAEALAVSTDQVYDEIRRGALPKVQMGKVVRVSREDLLAYVAAHRKARGKSK